MSECMMIWVMLQSLISMQLSNIFHKNTCNKPQRFRELINFSVAGRFWFIPLHVPNEDRKTWLVLTAAGALSLHIKGQCHSFCWSVRDGVYVSFRSRYFPSLCQNVPLTHGPLSVGMISAAQTHTHTHMHTHRSTVCHCITLHSLGHTVHIYSFITMRHFVREKAPFPRPLGLHSVSPRPGLLRVPVLQPACLTLLHNKLSKLANTAAHIASERLTKPINTAETIEPI